MKTETSLGRGVLTWHRKERVSDRYGAVYLIDEGGNSLTAAPCPSRVTIPTEIIGKKGTLKAVVLETRQSTHIGDLFRGVGLRTPNVNDVIVFGQGTLFAEPAIDGGQCVGLKPKNSRKVDWLDIRALYDAHEQTVELIFSEDQNV